MPTKKTSPRQRPDNTVLFLILLPIVFLLGLFTGYSLWGGDSPAAPTALAAQPTAVAPAPALPQATQITRYEVSADDDPFLGPEDAPVTIIEFSDFRCGYCKRWNDQVLPLILANYPTQVRYVYRDFPIFGEPSISAAEATHCAGEQDSYWPYFQAVFSNQYEFTTEGFNQYAQDLDLDVEAFSACMENHTYQDEVTADYYAGAGIGLQSTPTFFINGRIIIGALSFEDFKQVIDEELALLGQP